jgi:hypothetical protein
MDRFGLEHAVVVDTQDDHAESMRRHLGQVAAELLAEVIGPEDVLGVAWSRAVGAMAKRCPPVGAGRPAHRSHLVPGRSQLDRRRADVFERPAGRHTSSTPLRCPTPPPRMPSASSTTSPERSINCQGHQGCRRTRAVRRAVNTLRHSPDHDRRTPRGSACAPRCPRVPADGEPAQTDLTY